MHHTVHTDTCHHCQINAYSYQYQMSSFSFFSFWILMQNGIFTYHSCCRNQFCNDGKDTATWSNYTRNL